MSDSTTNQAMLPLTDAKSLVVLTVAGQSTAATADYSIRFVEYPDRPATPVLYFRGRRVITTWTLEISHAEPVDRWGCSG